MARVQARGAARGARRRDGVQHAGCPGAREGRNVGFQRGRPRQAATAGHGARRWPVGIASRGGGASCGRRAGRFPSHARECGQYDGPVCDRLAGIAGGARARRARLQRNGAIWAKIEPNALGARGNHCSGPRAGRCSGGDLAGRARARSRQRGPGSLVVGWDRGEPGYGQCFSVECALSCDERGSCRELGRSCRGRSHGDRGCRAADVGIKRGDDRISEPIGARAGQYPAIRHEVRRSWLRHERCRPSQFRKDIEAADRGRLVQVQHHSQAPVLQAL